MRVNGACHCGAIRLEAEIDPAQVGVCHCTDCQVLSGSPFRTLAFTTRAAMVVRGEPRIYVKVAQSGRRRAQAFCPACGTPLYAADADSDEGPVSLRTGFLAQSAELVPHLQLWRRSAASWVDNLGAVPADAEQARLDALRAKAGSS
jgi:hypothetical protein